MNIEGIGCHILHVVKKFNSNTLSQCITIKIAWFRVQSFHVGASWEYFVCIEDPMECNIIRVCSKLLLMGKCWWAGIRLQHQWTSLASFLWSFWSSWIKRTPSKWVCTGPTPSFAPPLLASDSQEWSLMALLHSHCLLISPQCHDCQNPVVWGVQWNLPESS